MTIKIRELTLERLERIEEDYYPTPAWMADVLIDDFKYSPGANRFNYRTHTMLEPCVGQGHIVKAFDAHGEMSIDWTSNDIDPKHTADRHEDATTDEYWDSIGEFDFVVSNPPFDEAFEIVRHAVEHAAIAVCMLLPLNFTESTQERRDWLDAHPPTRQVTMRRWSFRRNHSTAGIAVAWMVWGKHGLITPGLRSAPVMGLQGDLM